MKHTLKITIILIALFLLTQIIGLATVNKYINVEKIDGKLVIKHQDTIFGPQPEIEEKSYSAIPIVIAVLIGTGLILILMRFKLNRLWKLWFFMAVFFTLAVSFNVYIAKIYALAIAVILALIKVLKPNIIVHNFTEIFIYTGITIILLPYLNIISAFSLLIIISIYDMYAVWKSKHMIKLAKFQTKSKVFAGLMLNYNVIKEIKTKSKEIKIKAKHKNAILGGGDIAFPLLFSSAVMEHLILFKDVTKQVAFMKTSIITLLAALALTLLFLKSEKDKFYPAMPFISAGCFIGYLIVILI